MTNVIFGKPKYILYLYNSYLTFFIQKNQIIMEIYLMPIENIIHQLDGWVGETITVWTGEQKVRATHDPSISITGTLERHHEDSDHFRVVVNEGCYCYFRPRNVIHALQHPNRFRDGSKAVITINFPT